VEIKIGMHLEKSNPACNMPFAEFEWRILKHPPKI
jgi:hypothetical protein